RALRVRPRSARRADVEAARDRRRLPGCVLHQRADVHRAERAWHPRRDAGDSGQAGGPLADTGDCDRRGVPHLSDRGRVDVRWERGVDRTPIPVPILIRPMPSWRTARPREVALALALSAFVLAAP